MGGGHDGARHLPGALHRGAGRRDPPRPQPDNILQHHDAVVHQHPDAERQSGERHHVE